MPEPQFFFLCAVGRSGTTIFRTSLGLHPEIYYNNHENNVVADLLDVAQSNCTLKSRKFSMVVDQNRYNSIFRTTVCDLVWPDHELRQRPVHLAAINPLGSQMDYFCEVFPGAKFVCLVRNGIEVIASRMRYDSFAANSFESHCEVWTRSHEVARWGARNPDHFRLFRHEWFYDEAKIRGKLDSLTTWLGLSESAAPADNILSQLRHPTGRSTEARLGDRKADSADYSTDHSQRFEAMSAAEKTAYFQAKSDRYRDWTDEQKSLFESECGPFMEALGYRIPWL